MPSWNLHDAKPPLHGPVPFARVVTVEQNIRVRRRRIPVSAPHLALQLSGPPAGIADHDDDFLGPPAPGHGLEQRIHRAYRYILSHFMRHPEFLLPRMEHETGIGRYRPAVVNIHAAHVPPRRLDTEAPE